MYKAWDRNISLAGEFTQDTYRKDIVRKADDNRKWCLNPLSYIIFYESVQTQTETNYKWGNIFLAVAAKKDMVQPRFSWDTTLMLWRFYVLTWRVERLIPMSRGLHSFAGEDTAVATCACCGVCPPCRWLPYSQLGPACLPAKVCLEAGSSADHHTCSVLSRISRSLDGV